MISAVDMSSGALNWFSRRLQAALVSAVLTGLAGCADPDPVRLGGVVMGTTWSAQIVGPAAADLERAIQERLDAVDGRMSTYDESSELSRFNRNSSTDWIAVSAELADVVAEALRVAAVTEGAFDVTAGPLVDLWGFGPAQARTQLPDPAAIAATRARVGFGKLAVRESPPALRKAAAELALDLSAIAKGYAVDQAAALLDERGVRDYLVEIGGELRGRGRNVRGEPWSIAVEQPLVGERRIQRVLPLSDLSVATSGDYRNYFDHDGKRYSHAIDPRTGYPINHALASVTVLDRSATAADAYATGLLVLGAEEGYAVAQRHALAALFLIRDGERLTERTTPEFDRLTANRS